MGFSANLPDNFIYFRELYPSYSDGYEIDLRLLYQESIVYADTLIIIIADIVGATPLICANERIYLGAHPNLMTNASNSALILIF